MYDIAIWTPMNSKSGFGHFYRMLGLYEKLLYEKEKITYFSNEKYISIEDVNIISSETKDIKLIIKFLKKNSVKTIIIDNYAITSDDIDTLNKFFKTVCFDSQFYNNEIDVVINFNPFALNEYRYKHKSTKYFLGLEYMLFRKEILKTKKVDITSNDIFLSIGGSDVSEVTYAIIAYLPNEESYKIILGKGCSDEYYNKVSNRLKSLKIRYTLYRQPRNYFAILADCKYAISSCSTTTYELIYFAKPFVCINVIDNQNKLSSYLNENKILTLKQDNLEQISDIIKSRRFNLPSEINMAKDKSLELINNIRELTHEKRL